MGPEISRVLRLQISRQSAYEGGKVVSPKYAPPLTPRDTFLVLISVRACVNPRAIVRPEGLCQGKIAMYSIYNCTPDLPACNLVPQPTVTIYSYRLEKKCIYRNKGLVYPLCFFIVFISIIPLLVS
jgi:hypothetical protein